MERQPDFDFIAQYYDLIYASRADDLDMWLNLTANVEGKVLEIGCGTGRVMLPLLQAGKHVTGVDISDVALSAGRAKITAGGFDESAVLYRADMRTLDLPQKDFVFAFIPSNTFMHCLSIADQQATLHATFAHLQPGGTLVIDLYHPDPQALLEADGRVQLANQLIDDLTGHMVHWFVSRRLQLAEQIQEVTFILDEHHENGALFRRAFSFPMRYVHRFEMELLLTDAGFIVQEVLGDYDQSPFCAESPRMIFIAQKPN